MVVESLAVARFVRRYKMVTGDGLFGTAEWTAIATRLNYRHTDFQLLTVPLTAIFFNQLPGRRLPNPHRVDQARSLSETMGMHGRIGRIDEFVS